MAKRKQIEEVENIPKNTIRNSEPKTEIKKTTSKEKKESNSSKNSEGFFFRIKQFLLDEKTHKLTGLLLIGFSIFLLVAFVSYFFSWKTDQSIAESGQIDLSQQPKNVMGFIGARLSHLIIYNWFGIASFLLIPICFLFGVRLLYKKKLVSLNRAIGILGFLTIWSSGVLAYVFPKLLGGVLGGNFGYKLNVLLLNYTGPIGTIFIYLFSFLAFLIIAYNASLKSSFVAKLAKRKSNEEVRESSVMRENEVETKVDNVYTHRDEIDTIESEEEDDLNNIPIDELPEIEIQEEDDETPVPEHENIFLNSNATSSNDNANLELEMDEPLTNQNLTLENDSLELEIDKTDNDGFTIVKPISDSNEVSSSAESMVEKYGQYDSTLDLPNFKMPELNLLVDYGDKEIQINKEELEINKNKIVDTLRNYSIEIAKIKATVGPTVTLYEIVPAPGVRISKIKNLEDDIALSLAALGIRIIAPIPGKGTIGIEVPNQNPEMVPMQTCLKHDKFVNTKFDLPIAIGKTISNEVFITDLAKMPHLLMAGATGQGKSVGLNAILVSLLYKKHPSQIKFVMVDPKKVELTLYNKIEKHYLAKLPNEEEPIITDVKKALNTLNSLCIEMDTRYELLKNAQVRNLKEYNEKFINRKLNPNDGHRYLPYIVLVIDEFADLIMTAGKEVEMPIARLAQLARAIGIHLIIATQRPSVNIITGTIKANFPARIAFRVSSKVDSRTILDAGGAEQLIGRGDMLLSLGSDLIRLQCPFVDTPEVENICNFIEKQQGYSDAMYLPEFVGDEKGSKEDFEISNLDELFEEAAKIIVIHQQGSASLLQRRLNLGYNRAGRLIDQMEKVGIVGPNKGSKAREVLIKDEMELDEFLKSLR